MASMFIRFPIRRFIAFLACAVLLYMVIGKTLMPSSLKTTQVRDILSVEQKQQNQQQLNHINANNINNNGINNNNDNNNNDNNDDINNNIVNKNDNKPNAIGNNDRSQINEEVLKQLHQSSHQDAEKQRLKSPDLDRSAVEELNGTEKSSVMARQVGENALVSELNKADRLESRRRKQASKMNTTICADIDENPNLIGKLPQATLLITNLKEAEVKNHYPSLGAGGSWKPEGCLARYKVAIIIPFRDRQTHLTRLIDFLVPLLQRQLLDFRFIVTEQYGNDLFNKGRIMNAAFRLAEMMGVDCVIFHDVDMFPQDDHNSYGCPTTPRHIGAFVSTLGYQLWYKEIVGGVLAINMDDYRSVNGYSNMYWAWGGEDDDMGKRILSRNLTIERPDPKTGRFSMLKHVKRKRTAPRLIYRLLDSADTRWQTDGLNVTSWKIAKLYVRPLYYHLYVDVGTPPPEWRAS